MGGLCCMFSPMYTVMPWCMCSSYSRGVTSLNELAPQFLQFCNQTIVSTFHTAVITLYSSSSQPINSDDHCSQLSWKSPFISALSFRDFYYCLPYHTGQTAELPGAEASVWAQCAAPNNNNIIICKLTTRAMSEYMTENWGAGSCHVGGWVMFKDGS